MKIEVEEGLLWRLLIQSIRYALSRDNQLAYFNLVSDAKEILPKLSAEGLSYMKEKLTDEINTHINFTEGFFEKRSKRQTIMAQFY